MQQNDALALAHTRAWEQTKVALGPLPEVNEGTENWFAQRDQFFNEIMSELRSAEMIESDENL